MIQPMGPGGGGEERWVRPLHTWLVMSSGAHVNNTSLFSAPPNEDLVVLESWEIGEHGCLRIGCWHRLLAISYCPMRNNMSP
jgi:hypothetical protein